MPRARRTYTNFSRDLLADLVRENEELKARIQAMEPDAEIGRRVREAGENAKTIAPIPFPTRMKIRDDRQP